MVINRVVHHGNGGRHHVSVRLEPLEQSDAASRWPPPICGRELAATLIDYGVDPAYLDALAERLARRCRHCQGRGYVRILKFDFWNDCGACDASGLSPAKPAMEIDELVHCGYRWGRSEQHACAHEGLHGGGHECFCGAWLVEYGSDYWFVTKVVPVSPGMSQSEAATTP